MDSKYQKKFALLSMIKMIVSPGPMNLCLIGTTRRRDKASQIGGQRCDGKNLQLLLGKVCATKSSELYNRDDHIS